MIVPGNFGGDAFTDLLFYDRGAAWVSSTRSSGGEIAFLKTETGWRSSWDMILPLRIGVALPHSCSTTVLREQVRSTRPTAQETSASSGRTSIGAPRGSRSFPCASTEQPYVPPLLRGGYRIRRAVLRRH